MNRNHRYRTVAKHRLADENFPITSVMQHYFPDPNQYDQHFRDEWRARDVQGPSQRSLNDERMARYLCDHFNPDRRDIGVVTQTNNVIVGDLVNIRKLAILDFTYVAPRLEHFLDGDMAICPDCDEGKIWAPNGELEGICQRCLGDGLVDPDTIKPEDLLRLAETIVLPDPADKNEGESP